MTRVWLTPCCWVSLICTKRTAYVLACMYYYYSVCIAVLLLLLTLYVLLFVDIDICAVYTGVYT